MEAIRNSMQGAWDASASLSLDWSDALLLAALLVSVATDIRSRKIYNAVTMPALAAALLGHGLAGGWPGLAGSLLGAAAGFGILLIPYLLGGMGAGDVKLLTVVGALKGAAFVAVSAVYMALIGGVMALAILLLRKGAAAAIRAWSYYLYAFRCGVVIPAPRHLHPGSAAYPYGLAIAGGSMLFMLVKG